MTDDRPLTFMEHLRELRTVLFRSVIALVISFPLSYFIVRYFNVFDFLKNPAIARLPDLPFIFTDPTENVGAILKVTLLLALVIALPFIVYQIVTFVRPALTRKERTYLYTMLPTITICFLLGAAFAYFVLLPPAFNFLFTFGTDIAEPTIKIGKYVNLLTTLVFWIGLCFEIPIIIYFLSRIGVVTPEWLAKYRKFFYIIALVLGAVITPTIDPVNQLLVAVPIVILFEVGIVLSKLATGHTDVARIKVTTSVIVSVLVGIVLIASGTGKVFGFGELPGHTIDFLGVILPAALQTPAFYAFIGDIFFPYLLPWIEIIIGLLLVVGITPRLMAVLAMLLFAIFMANNAWTLSQGVDVFPDCACFGIWEQLLGVLTPRQALYMDIGLFALSLIVLLLHPARFFSSRIWLTQIRFKKRPEEQQPI